MASTAFSLRKHAHAGESASGLAVATIPRAPYAMGRTSDCVAYISCGTMHSAWRRLAAKQEGMASPGHPHPWRT